MHNFSSIEKIIAVFKTSRMNCKKPVSINKSDII